MNALHTILNELNDCSEMILNEIYQEEASFEKIQSELEQREALVQKLGPATEANPKHSLSEEERVSLKFLVDTFVELNDKIQSNLQSVLDQHKNTLGTAVKQRKAESGYRVLRNPDISYF